MTALPAHSHVGASSMHRWANCPGSVRLSADCDDSASAYAAEGSVAHGIAEKALKGKEWGAIDLDTIVRHEDFDILVTEEMLDAVSVYVNEVHRRRREGDVLLVEHKFHLSKLHAALFGTNDSALWSPRRKHLTVFDYKHGAGVGVEAEDNEQLWYYALGALVTLGYNAETVTVVIVQPRCPHSDGPIREQTFSAIELLDFATDLVEAVKRTEAPDAPLKVGDWCRWCPAAGKCPAQAEHAQALAQIAFSAPAKLPPTPESLTIEQIAQVLDRLPILEGWVKSVREYAYAQAEGGNAPPNYKLVAKVAHRKLKPDASPHMLASVADCDVAMLYEEPKFKGIAELEKLMPGKNAKERAAKLEPFVVKESTGHVLVHESDKRPAINSLLTAQQVFQPVEQTQ